MTSSIASTSCDAGISAAIAMGIMQRWPTIVLMINVPVIKTFNLIRLELYSYMRLFSILDFSLNEDYFEINDLRKQSKLHLTIFDNFLRSGLQKAKIDSDLSDSTTLYNFSDLLLRMQSGIS